MDYKSQTAAKKPTTISKLTVEDALDSESSSDTGTLGSYARQPQSSLASSRRDAPDLRVDQEIYGRKTSFADQRQWIDSDDSDDDDLQMQQITQNAKQKVQNNRNRQEEETKGADQPASLQQQSKIKQDVDILQRIEELSKPKPAPQNRGSTIVSGNFRSGVIQAGFNSKSTVQVGRMSTLVHTIKPFQTVDDLLDDSDSDDQFVEKIQPMRRQQTNQSQDFTRLGQRQLDPRQEPAAERLQIDILQIIEQNEKKNEPLLEQIVNQEAQLLSCDQEHNEQKKEIIKFDQLALLSAHIHDEKQKYAGFVTCAATYGKYLFIGNIKGYIRVFDLESTKIADLRPLYDAQLAGNRVMCISLTQGMQYLVSGYKSGAIAVWDLQKYKLEKLITDVHASEIMGAKIFHITDENVINIISAEVKGPVRLIEISSKSFFGGLNHSKVEIYQQRLKTVTGVQIHQPSDRQKQTYWGSKSLVVIGAVSEVVVCTMRPICEVLKIKRPQICKTKSIPYFDFGYGLTPEKQDASVLILAVAWDQIIQLIYFEEGREHKIRMDGIYYTDSEISSCYFTGESILVILQNQKAVKMLYTKKFHHGDYNLLSQQEGQQIEAESNRRQIREVTKFAEIEKGQDEKKQIKWPRSQLIEEADGQKYINLNQTVVRFKRHIFYICDRNEQITRACVLTYQEYLDRLRQQSKTWLYLLKSTLEIFSGDLKGLANVPDEKNAREREMMSFMKRHLLESLQSALPQQSSSIVQDEKKLLVSNQMETIAIRAAIEFCLNLQEFDFLFEDVCDYFTDRNLQDQFVRGLEQFVLSGKLRQVKLPQIIIRTMIHECEKSKKFQQLERLIQQLDLSDYAFIDDLEILCQSQFMVSALLYILMTQNRDQSGTKSCINILNSMYKIMIHAQNIELKNERDKRNQLKTQVRVVGPSRETYIEEEKNTLLEQAIRKQKIQDLERLLGQISAEDKFELEKSHVYIGYKFLWIIQMFLKGKKFPYGDLTEPQWRQHVMDIVNFITTEEYLKEILEFDPEMFFRVISRLFRGRPWQFLSEAQVNSQDCSFDPDDILRIIETRCNKTKRVKNDASIVNSFYVFILHVTIAQHEEIKKGATDKPVAFGVRSLKPMHMDYGMVFTAIESQLLPKPVGVSSLEVNQIDETLVIGALRAKQLKKEDIDKLHAIIKPQPETPAFINIKLELHESRKEYVDAFNYLLKSKTQQMRVFDWLDHILTNLQEDDTTQADFVSLKSAARLNMRDIIQLEVNDHAAKIDQKANSVITKVTNQKEETVHQTQRSYELIHKWFDGDQQFLFKLASEDLASQPQTQFQFLKTFISLKEKAISDTIRESIFQPERQKQADIYNKMLIIFTRRLFENAEASVAVSWVSKDYFPTRECLEICRFFENYMAEAVLMEKLGDGMQAIKIYLKAIEKIDVKRISDQIRLVINGDWNVGRVGKFDQLVLFDQILDLACQIASKKEGDGGQLKYGEEGWFQILEFLQQLLIQSSANIEKFENKIRNSVRTSLKLDDLKDFESFDNRNQNRSTVRIDAPQNLSTEIQTRVEQLKQFIMARISYLLQRDDNHLSLRRVAERLGLQFEQVKKLCGDKLELLKGNARRENGCHRIFEHDNFYVFKQSEQFVPERQVYHTQNRCRGCKRPLLNSPSLIMIEAFACGHVYHAICLSGKSECSTCQKHYLDDRKGHSDANLEGRSVSDIAKSNQRMSQEQKNRATQRLLEMLDSNIESAKLNLTDFF